MTGFKKMWLISVMYVIILNTFYFVLLSIIITFAPYWYILIVVNNHIAYDVLMWKAGVNPASFNKVFLSIRLSIPCNTFLSFCVRVIKYHGVIVQICFKTKLFSYNVLFSQRT